VPGIPQTKRSGQEASSIVVLLGGAIYTAISTSISIGIGTATRTIDDALVASFYELLEGKYDSATSSAHSSGVALERPIHDNATDLVSFDNVRESFEAVAIDGASNVLSIAIDGIESQGFQFDAGYPKGRMRGDRNAYPVLVKV